MLHIFELKKVILIGLHLKQIIDIWEILNVTHFCVEMSDLGVLFLMQIIRIWETQQSEA
jgi:hypothetical protein